MWHTYWINWMDILDSAAGLGFLWIIWRSHGTLLPPPWDRFLQGVMVMTALGFWGLWLRNVGLFVPYLGAH